MVIHDPYHYQKGWKQVGLVSVPRCTCSVKFFGGPRSNSSLNPPSPKIPVPKCNAKVRMKNKMGEGVRPLWKEDDTCFWEREEKCYFVSMFFFPRVVALDIDVHVHIQNQANDGPVLHYFCGLGWFWVASFFFLIGNVTQNLQPQAQTKKRKEKRKGRKGGQFFFFFFAMRWCVSPLSSIEICRRRG